MQCRAYFFLILIIALTQVDLAPAQIPRIKIPRPAMTKPQLPQQAEPKASGGQPEASNGVAASGQTGKAAIEFDSLMNMRFYEANGSFLVEDIEVVFPPSGVQAATFEIVRSTGELVASVPLRYAPIVRFSAFGIFRPVPGNPGTLSVGQVGDFMMKVRVGRDILTAMPFSLSEQVSSDPFNPGRKFVREGEWRDLGFFSQITDDPDATLHFNFWLSTRELPAGMRRPKVTLHLMANGKEVAASRGPVVPDTIDYYFYERKELIMETKPKQKWLNLTDLVKQDGEIVMLVKADGQTIKSYRTRVQGGVLEGLDRSRVDTMPRTNFISPRYVDLSDRSRSDLTMRDMFWVKRGQ